MVTVFASNNKLRGDIILHFHCLMFQSVITPNGLICHLFGPLEARRHESSLLQELARKMNKANEDPYVIYEDPAYPVSKHILAPFRGPQLTPAMSAVRTSVEWGYGKVITYFAFFHRLYCLSQSNWGIKISNIQ